MHLCNVTLFDDPPEALRAAAALDPTVAEALGRVRECSGVRSGPRSGGGSDRLTAYLLRLTSEEDAATLAAAATGQATDQRPVRGRPSGVLCVVYTVEPAEPGAAITDTLEQYTFSTNELLAGPHREFGENPPFVPNRAPHPDVDTLLLIEVQYDRHAPVHQWWLAGPPPHGTHPDPAGAWQTLSDDGDPFRGYEASTQDFHGPERAHLRGFWRRSWVERRFGRHEGEGAREWDRPRGFLEPEALRR